MDPLIVYIKCRDLTCDLRLPVKLFNKDETNREPDEGGVDPTVRSLSSAEDAHENTHGYTHALAQTQQLDLGPGCPRSARWARPDPQASTCQSPPDNLDIRFINR